MKINYTNKKAGKNEQEQAFLKLSAQDRFYAWLDLLYRSRSLPQKEMRKGNDSFVVQIPSEKK